MKKILWIIFTVFWMIIIFMFSAMPSNDSDKKSKGIIKNVATYVIKKTNQIGFTNINIDKDIDEIVIFLNRPLRKLMHISVYFVLSLFTLKMFYIFGFTKNKLYLYSFILCFIYACSDEWHQTFINGRSSSFIDVIIDSFGIVFGIFIYKKLFIKKNSA